MEDFEALITHMMHSTSFSLSKVLQYE